MSESKAERLARLIELPVPLAVLEVRRAAFEAVHMAAHAGELVEVDDFIQTALIQGDEHALKQGYSDRAWALERVAKCVAKITCWN